MGINTQYVSVDITKKTAPQIIRLGQGDKNGTTITARIYNDGAEYPMTDKTARFCMRTPDGKASYSVNNSSTSGNLVTFNINEQYAASVAGKTDVAYIEVLSGSTVICSTSRISVIVYRSASEGLPVSGAYSDALEEAIHSASTAASSANSAASNANTKSTRAENAAIAANNAADSVNAAKDAANAAASAATTAAEAANSAKDTANAAATAANTAADSANAATSEANAAIEAMGDISELAVPEMTASVRGGAKVGGSTQVIGGKLEVKLSESATGTSVTTGSTSVLRELQVHGRSVQDGTPTPDAPVEVQVMKGRNILSSNTQSSTIGAAGNFYPNTVLGLPAGTYTFSFKTELTSGAWQFRYRSNESSGWTATETRQIASSKSITFTTYNVIHQACAYCDTGGTFTDIQLEKGSTTTPYMPYGSIGIIIGDTATSIDLQGNTLASLPDGTRDELHVDSAGRVWIVKRVGAVTFDGDESWSKANTAPYNAYIRSTTANSGFSDAKIAESQYNPKNIVLLCDRFEYKGRYSANKDQYGLTISGTAAATDFCFDWRNIAESMTVDEWKAWLAEHPITVCYPLATPQEIDLGYIDPPAIPSGSVVTVSASLTPTFDLSCWTEHASELADIPDAITTLAEVIYDKQESIASSIAPVEGSTASANHAVDDYLMLGARLYRVTTAIASGERIIPGTNVTETTVMAEIVSLLS